MTRDKALTDQAATLDAQIAAFRSEIKKAGPVRSTKSSGKTFAILFGLPDTDAAKVGTWKLSAMMIAAELFIMLVLLADEILDKHERAPARAAVIAKQAARRREQEEAAPADVIEHEAIASPEARYAVPQTLPAPARVIEPQAQIGAPRMHTAARKAAEAAEGSPASQTFMAPAKPRLVASEAVPVGSVAQIVSSLLEPGTARSKLGVVDLYKSYVAACTAAGKRPIAPAEFPAAIASICEACNIGIRDDGAAGIFLMKVQIRETAKQGAHQ